MKDLFSVEGKIAWVTGGSQGIGHMIAEGLVDAGATVYITSRKQTECDETAASLSERGGGRCHSIPGDLSRTEEIERLVAELARQAGQLHVLVNNAGSAWGAPFGEYPVSAWSKVLNLNVTAVFDLIQRCAPMLHDSAAEGDPGRVVNIGSIDGFRVPELENYAYSASKAAVHHLSRVLAQRLASQNITVNAIAPGPFPSRMMQTTLAERGDRWRAKAPLGRLGEPQDIAGTTIYLASRAGAYVTGQVLAVDGGFSTRPW